jgi:hypothetical protein
MLDSDDDNKPHPLESLPLEPALDGELLLTRLGTYDADVDIDLRQLLPDREPPIFASWYSGKLRVPMGDQLLYCKLVRAGAYHSRPAGRVVKERNVDHTSGFSIGSRCSHLMSPDGVIEGRGHNIPSLEWLTDEGRALVERRSGH